MATPFRLTHLFPLVLLVSAMLLTGCDDADDGEPHVRDPEPIAGVKMPAGLQDCKIFRVHGEGGFAVLVTRCPHSVATTNGKVTSVVAEDEDLEAAEIVPTEIAAPAK